MSAPPLSDPSVGMGGHEVFFARLRGFPQPRGLQERFYSLLACYVMRKCLGTWADTEAFPCCVLFPGVWLRVTLSPFIGRKAVSICFWLQANLCRLVFLLNFVPGSHLGNAGEVIS